MNILAIDTAATSCSAMLRKTDGTGFFRAESATQHHSRHILGLVNELILASGLSLEDMDLLVWNAGPGSFTGLRIGASVIQALAYSLNIPVLSLSSLEVMAYAAIMSAPAADTTIGVALDARMEGVYWASFITRDGKWERAEPDQLLEQNALQHRWQTIGNTGRLAVGDAWIAVAPTSDQYRDITTSAKDVMGLALTKDKAAWLDNPADCLPNYVQNSISWQKRRFKRQTDTGLG